MEFVVKPQLTCDVGYAIADNSKTGKKTILYFKTCCYLISKLNRNETVRDTLRICCCFYITIHSSENRAKPRPP